MSATADTGTGDIFMINGINVGSATERQGSIEVSKIDLDDLYTSNHQLYEKKRAIYERVLGLAHKTIQTKARDAHQQSQKYCWYQVPDFMMGVPAYNAAECTGFIYTELIDNGFKVRYVHPGWLFIVWAHWVPAYVRHEIKNRHGITINSLGEIIPEEGGEDGAEGDDPAKDAVGRNPKGELFATPGGGKTGMASRTGAGRTYKPVDSYKPRGVYNDELLNKIGDKMGRAGGGAR